jgi:hypothetical protein
MDIARHHGTSGKIPATTSTMKITAAATAHVSNEKRGARARAGAVPAGDIEEVVMVRAPW